MKKILLAISIIPILTFYGCSQNQEGKDEDIPSSGIRTGNSQEKQLKTDTSQVTGESNVPIDTGEVINTSGETIKYNKKTNRSFDTTVN